MLRSKGSLEFAFSLYVHISEKSAVYKRKPLLKENFSSKTIFCRTHSGNVAMLNSCSWGGRGPVPACWECGCKRRPCSKKIEFGGLCVNSVLNEVRQRVKWLTLDRPDKTNLSLRPIWIIAVRVAPDMARRTSTKVPPCLHRSDSMLKRYKPTYLVEIYSIFRGGL